MEDGVNKSYVLRRQVRLFEKYSNNEKYMLCVKIITATKYLNLTNSNRKQIKPNSIYMAIGDM